MKKKIQKLLDQENGTEEFHIGFLVDDQIKIFKAFRQTGFFGWKLNEFEADLEGRGQRFW